MFFAASYSYFVYPLALLLFPRRRVALHAGMRELPSVSLIITAHNEEHRIEEKIRNSLLIDYPRDRLEILVASDASTDATDAIVRNYEPAGVRLVRANERKGKEHAQWHAIEAARSDILVFSDTATKIPEDGIRRLVRHFDDPAVGAVSSEDRFVKEGGGVAGEGAYVKYEMWLRRLESSVNSLVGLSGSFFAARRDVCREWDIHVPSDFNTALNSVRAGYVAVTAADVLGYYSDIKDERKEYNRKMRTVIRGISALFVKPEVLNPWKFGLFSLQVWSHKVMRWLVPWFMVLTLASNIAVLRAHWIYQVTLAGQLLFYALAAAGVVSAELRKWTAIKLPYFFIQVNLAIAHATLAFLAGRRMTVWEPSRR
jgi:glycosyltransferase involved in cell wall biosynthesis